MLSRSILPVNVGGKDRSRIQLAILSVRSCHLAPMSSSCSPPSTSWKVTSLLAASARNFFTACKPLAQFSWLKHPRVHHVEVAFRRPSLDEFSLRACTRVCEGLPDERQLRFRRTQHLGKNSMKPPQTAHTWAACASIHVSPRQSHRCLF